MRRLFVGKELFGKKVAVVKEVKHIGNGKSKIVGYRLQNLKTGSYMPALSKPPINKIEAKKAYKIKEN